MNDEEIFHQALARSCPQERAAYLDQVCGGDSALRASVEALLRANIGASGFMDRPLAALLATVDDPISERPGVVIDSYKLMEQIGEGGMGLVFVAEQQQPVRRKVALKVIKPGMDTRQVVARFEAERQALALMDHPNIAKVHDGGTAASGRPYFVMELVKGVPITEYCDQNQVPIRQRLELFVSVCQAVQHAHQKGIIHRDLKPSNVLVVSHDGTPVVKVIDFGIAKAIGQRLTDKTLYTQFSQMVGTPLYMSPEQAGQSGLDVDTRSDIYTLGVLLYELLTGTTPFDKERLREVGYDEIRRIIREEEPPKPSTRISTLGKAAKTVSMQRQCDPKRLRRLFLGELDWIVMKALEKDRNRRYETANSFAADVQRYLANEPVQACPPSTGYRMRKFARRHQTALLMLAAMTTTLLGGMGLAIWQAIEARAAAEAEKQAKELALAREAQTNTVLDFLENKILAAVRPEGREGGLGHDITLRKALEAALPFVEKSFVDQPVIEIRLRMILGSSFDYLGEEQLAAQQFQAALKLLEKHLGPDHPDTLGCMNNLGNAYFDLGQVADAVKLHTEILARRKALLGDDHVDTLQSMHNLAAALRKLGRHEEARRLNAEVLAARRVKLGPDHPDTLRSMNNLANDYSSLGRLTEALTLHEKTLELRQGKFGPDHPDTLGSLDNVAGCHAALGHLVESLQMHEKTLRLRQAKIGPNHPDTLQTMFTVARLYLDLGRAADAAKLHEAVLSLRQAKLGAAHPDTLLSMHYLALSYDALGRKVDALKLREKTTAGMKTELGADHANTLTSMAELANSYNEAGRHLEAIKLNEETLARRQEKFGPDHPDTLRSMNNLAGSYTEVGRHAEAIKLYEQAVQRMKGKFGPEHPDTLLAATNLAFSLVRASRGGEAVPIIDDCLAHAAGKILHPRLLPTLIDLRLRHFERAKSVAGCRATAELWEKLKRTDPGSLYDAACLWAVTAALLRAGDANAKAADAEADRAMKWLTQAVAAGYANVAHMKRDRDLNALRARPDFQKLVAELEARQAKLSK